MTTQAAEPTVLSKKSMTGTIWVAGGLGILGAAGYVFLTVTAGVPGYAAALASLYLLTAIVGPGVFGALELETSRLVARRSATGEGAGAVTRQLGLLSASVLGVVLIVLLALSPVLVPRVFNGNVALLGSLCAIAVGYAVMAFPRGVFAGQQKLNGFALTLVAEGLLRLIPTLLFFALGVKVASAYGWVWGLAPLAAALVSLKWVWPDRSGPRTPWRELISAVGWLMASSFLALGMANLGPVITTALLTEDVQRAGVFAFVFVLFRIPHFIFVSLQTVLLPMFSRAAARGDVAGLRKAIKQAILIVVGFGLLSGAVILVAAPYIVDFVFKPGHNLSFGVMALLALGTAAFMLVQQVLQQGLLSVAGHRWVAVAWFCGMIAFGASFLLPIDPVDAAIVAQYTGVAVTGILLICGLRSSFRKANGA